MARKPENDAAQDAEQDLSTKSAAKAAPAVASKVAPKEEEEKVFGSRRVKQPRPVGLLIDRPMVAIVGRPNIGKSTLFNRLVGSRMAIVEDVEGVTRDRHYADAFFAGRDIVMVDTGGFDPDSDDPMKEGITNHVKMALMEADLVICVLLADAPPTMADEAAVKLLRRANKPVIYVANKADSKVKALESFELYKLGVPEVIPISALHGLGMAELENAVRDKLPPLREHSELSVSVDIPRIAIIGRPNAGKSSLTNRLLGEEHQLVDDRPGTTVDAIDALFDDGERQFVFIDTAGIRRKRGVDGGVEGIAVLKAIRAIERSDAVLLLVDAHEGVAEQDAKLAGLVVDRGRGLVIGLNKADLMNEDSRKQAITRTSEILAFAPWAEIVVISAKTGRSMPRLLSALETCILSHRKRVTTGDLNRFFEEVLDKHPPPTQGGRSVRLYYITQAEVEPPRFIVVTNHPEDVHFSYQRYVTNALRARFGFQSTPLKVMYRPKNKKGDRDIPT